MSYFQVRQDNKGYVSVLRRFRTPVGIGGNTVFPEIEARVDGSIPAEVARELPVFGMAPTAQGTYTVLNSGGRGFLLSDEATHLRAKGADLTGDITLRVAASDNNLIPNEIGVAAEFLRRRGGGKSNGELWTPPTFGDKPFSFFTQTGVVNETQVTEILGEGYEGKGFHAPYTVAGTITYPTVRWDGRECKTLFFNLPSVESDIRFGELERFAVKHLRYASLEQLEDIKDCASKVFRKLTSWYGFTNGVLREQDFVPTYRSHQMHNYTICHVAEGKVGAARVDHTSTVREEERSREYQERVEKEFLFFANIPLAILHAISLAKDGSRPLDKDRYVGFFDEAYNWGNRLLFPSTIEGYVDELRELQNAFIQGRDHKDPEPVDEKDLLTLVDKIAAIEIDQRKQEWIDRAGYPTMRSLRETINVFAF